MQIQVEPNHQTLPLDYNPQQKEYFYDDVSLKFTSKFDSGNMYKLEKRDSDSTVIKKITQKLNFYTKTL